MRLLDAAGIHYETGTYEVDEMTFPAAMLPRPHGDRS